MSAETGERHEVVVIGAGRDAAYVVERIAEHRRSRDPVRAVDAGSEAA